jgi:anti-anti-sigma regulatory factor
MLKISCSETGNGSVTLRLEGEITGPWVDETSRVCQLIIAQGQALRLDLEQVTFADRAAVELLGRLGKREAVLDHCSPFLKAQLRL